MKVIIAGSRTITNYTWVKQCLDSLDNWEVSEVVSGKARGVDTMGERWARENSIPVKGFPADWKSYGKAAGPIRNRAMADYADGLIAFWDWKSKGTLDMIDKAESFGLRYIVFKTGNSPRWEQLPLLQDLQSASRP